MTEFDYWDELIQEAFEDADITATNEQIEKESMWIRSTKPCFQCNAAGTVRHDWGRDVTCRRCNGKGRVR